MRAHADTTSSVEIKSAIDEWSAKIDEIYDQLNSTQEHYFNITSKEKVLSCRVKMKGYLESVRTLFEIEGMSDVSIQLIFVNIVRLGHHRGLEESY